MCERVGKARGREGEEEEGKGENGRERRGERGTEGERRKGKSKQEGRIQITHE